MLQYSSSDYKKYITAINSFSIDWFQEILEKEPGKNHVVSPMMIRLLFNMLSTGVGTADKKIIKECFLLEDDEKTEKIFRSRLIEALKSQGIGIANLIHVKGGTLNPHFREEVNADFSAEMMSDKNAKVINDWVSKQTQGKISEITNDQEVSQSPFMMLNAFNFSATWNNTFDQTAQEEFTNCNGTKVTTEFMNYDEVFKYRSSKYTKDEEGNYKRDAKGTYITDENGEYILDHGNKVLNPIHNALKTDYYKDDEVAAIRMLYRDSETQNLEKTHFWVILPHNNKELSKINGERLEKMRQVFERKFVDVRLPSFELNEERDIKPLLVNRGAGSLWDHLDASNMLEKSPAGLRLDRAVQKATLKVDTQGTEAAVVTSISVSKAYEQPEYHPRDAMFKCDHEFMVALEVDGIFTLFANVSNLTPMTQEEKKQAAIESKRLKLSVAKSTLPYSEFKIRGESFKGHLKKDYERHSVFKNEILEDRPAAYGWGEVAKKNRFCRGYFEYNTSPIKGEAIVPGYKLEGECTNTSVLFILAPNTSFIGSREEVLPKEGGKRLTFGKFTLNKNNDNPSTISGPGAVITTKDSCIQVGQFASGKPKANKNAIYYYDKDTRDIPLFSKILNDSDTLVIELLIDKKSMIKTSEEGKYEKIKLWDQSSYEGVFTQQVSGKGTKTSKSGKVEKGVFLHGQLIQGTIFHVDGSECVGTFKDGLLEGQGEVFYPNGTHEEGLFKEGKIITV